MDLSQYTSHDRIDVACSKCGKVQNRKVVSIRYNVKKNSQYVCHQCGVKAVSPIVAAKLRSRNLGNKWADMSQAQCSCGAVIKLRIRNIKSNLRRNNGKYRCQACALKDSHESGKFNKIYTDGFKQKLRANGVTFWESARATWRERLVNDDFRALMSFYGKKAWTDEFRQKMAEVRLKQPRTSSIQKILYSILDDMGIKYFDDQSDQCRIAYFTFDCRIDPQPGIGIQKPLLVEVQGDYWHSLKSTIMKDKSKATYIRNYHPQFMLKYLWEHEFNARERIVETLKYWLGIVSLNRVDFEFDDVSIKQVGVHDAELLISKYHYAGRLGRKGLIYGAYIRDVLASVCVFASAVRQETVIRLGVPYGDVLELSRFCIHPSYQRQNFATWFISRCLRQLKLDRPNIKLVVAFSDKGFNHLGTIYKASNWMLDGEVEPDYWYVDEDGFVIHKKTLWNHASKMSMTESAYCDKFGYRRVYGDSKLRFLWKY
jgi:GNAT superfamily N-acetyltransferase/predicted RNA-binding Zn-ribbon protein involved in translation (DUF1610 family)